MSSNNHLNEEILARDFLKEYFSPKRNFKEYYDDEKSKNIEIKYLNYKEQVVKIKLTGNNSCEKLEIMITEFHKNYNNSKKHFDKINNKYNKL